MIFVPPPYDSGDGDGAGRSRVLPIALVALGAAALAAFLALRVYGGEAVLDELGPRTMTLIVSAAIALLGVAAAASARQQRSRPAQPRVSDRLDAIERQIGELGEQVDARFTELGARIEEATRASLAQRDDRYR